MTGVDLVQWQIRIARGERLDARPGAGGDAARPRHRVPHLRRGCRRRLHAVARPHRRPARASRARYPRRRRRRRGRRGAGVLRPADLEAESPGATTGRRRSRGCSARCASTRWSASRPRCRSSAGCSTEPVFAAADFHTGYLDELLQQSRSGDAVVTGPNPSLSGGRRRWPSRVFAAQQRRCRTARPAAWRRHRARRSAAGRRSAAALARAASGWRRAGPAGRAAPMTLIVETVQGQRWRVEVTEAGAIWTVTVDRRRLSASFVDVGRPRLVAAGSGTRRKLRGGARRTGRRERRWPTLNGALKCADAVVDTAVSPAAPADGAAQQAATDGPQPRHGADARTGASRCWSRPATPCASGQGLVVVEAMKMENELRAARAGVVSRRARRRRRAGRGGRRAGDRG